MWNAIESATKWACSVASDKQQPKITIYPSKWKIRLVSSFSNILFSICFRTVVHIKSLWWWWCCAIGAAVFDGGECFLLADGVILVVVLLHRFIYVIGAPVIVIVLVNLFAFFHLSLHNLHGDNDNAKKATTTTTKQRSIKIKWDRETRQSDKAEAKKELVLMPSLYCLHCCFLIR